MKMKKTGFISLIVLLIVAMSSCETEPADQDPCELTRLPQLKEYEIRIAVRIPGSNPVLPGGLPGSQKPSDFRDLVVSGTIEKVECDGLKSARVYLGNSYITSATDPNAPIEVPDAWWIGNAVYVYEFDNTRDMLGIDLNVRITMEDGRSYTNTVSDSFEYNEIMLVPGQRYYYVLVDIYSGLWTRV